MAFVEKQNDSTWLSELEDIADLTNKKNVPPSFHHYEWASQFCIGKNVLEIDCRAGYGVDILSRVADRCTGSDDNSEAIKYAMRNFFHQGKTKFTTNVPDAKTFDVIVCFNQKYTSGDQIARLQSTFHLVKTQELNGKILILGFSNDGGNDLQPIAESIRSLALEHNVDVYLCQQSAINPFDIKAYGGERISNIRRLIAVVRSSPHFSETHAALGSPRKREALVSIVIPAYNRADLITETVDSALRQTYPELEVIVVDDGSTDNTKDVLLKYGDKIKYYHKPNGGIGSALNHGISKMNGKWFKWLSSDDLLTPNAVARLLDYADETGAKIIYTDYDIIDEKSRFVRKFTEPHFLSYYEYASALWTRFIGNGSSSLIERSCFDEVGLFDESVRSAEDYDWWLRACLLHGYRFFHLPESTLQYRIHSKQLTAAVKHNAYLTDERIRNRVKEQVISSNPAWWKTLVHYQRIYSKQNQRGGLARRMLRKSLLHMPESVRKSAMKTWQNSVKPRVDSQN
jgi:glycosyltransferase involved in cell wall biosynthesis